MAREYKIILNRLKRLETLFSLELLTHDSPDNSLYPIFKIQLGIDGLNKKHALISAGIHGDEPAGVETICSFLENQVYLPFLEEWKLVFLPCLNPYGYDNNNRLNRKGKDLNRLFKTFFPPLEVQAAQNVLSHPFDLNLELHEDCDSRGFYLYIKATKESFLGLGKKILTDVENVMPINKDLKIDDQISDGGMLHRLRDLDSMEWWPMAGYASIQKVPCIFTLETAPSFPMSTRIEAHTLAICSALNNYSNHI